MGRARSREVSSMLQGSLYGTGELIEIEVREGVIRRRRPLTGAQSPPNRWIVPGFFDLQVNGFAGVDFCTPALTIADVEKAAAAILATGTTRFLPTIITGALDDMCRELFIMSTAIETSPLVRQMCPGIHVEGPFIHPEDGPRG